MDIEFNVKKDLYIFLSGELDHNALKIHKERLELKIATTPADKIIINLKGLTFMDSSGISFIYNAYKTADEFMKKVIVVCTDEKFRKILNLAKMQDFVEIVPKWNEGGVADV